MWSKIAQETTRENLYNGAPYLFNLDYIVLKKWTGVDTSSIYGFMKLEDLMDSISYNTNWIIRDSNHEDIIEEFETIDELIEGGWVLD